MRSKTILFNKYVALRGDDYSVIEAREAIHDEVKRFLDRTERHFLYLECEQWEFERTLDDLSPEQRVAVKRSAISNIRMEVVECEVCGTPNAVGSPHCHVCDTVLGVKYDSSVSINTLKNRVGTHYEFNSYLVLVLHDTNSVLRLQPQITPRGLRLGRASRKSRPDVDLEPVGAIKFGVSRQHAIIRFDRAQRCLVIEDNSSTNGTFVNDIRLSAHQEMIISDGDVIELGHLVFTAYIKSDEKIRYQRASFV
ncbi:MAG: FHA domain-containing protein [Chloroflexota bacterium]